MSIDNANRFLTMNLSNKFTNNQQLTYIIMFDRNNIATINYLPSKHNRLCIEWVDNNKIKLIFEYTDEFSKLLEILHEKLLKNEKQEVVTNGSSKRH